MIINSIYNFGSSLDGPYKCRECKRKHHGSYSTVYCHQCYDRLKAEGNL